MSKFGGSTKMGGGALFGGGPSLYESWINTIWDLMGEGVFERARGDTDKNITKLISVIAGQFAGAEVDALRIRSEGQPGTAIEALDDWAQIMGVSRFDTDDDTRRETLAQLMYSVTSFSSDARITSAAENIIDRTSSGLTTEAYVHQCTMAQCVLTDNSGDGCRYSAVLVPFWLWEKYRPWFRSLQELCDRLDSYYCETTVCCSNDNVPMDKINALSGAEPAFYCNKSIIDRDVVRD
jgi:hypothetical protein